MLLNYLCNRSVYRTDPIFSKIISQLPNNKSSSYKLLAPPPAPIDPIAAIAASAAVAALALRSGCPHGQVKLPSNLTTMLLRACQNFGHTKQKGKLS